MCQSGFYVWLMFLLVVVYAIENQENFMSKDKINNSVHYKSHVNFAAKEDHNENSIRQHDLMQHHYRSNYMKNLHKKENQDTPNKLRENFTKIDDKNNFTISYEFRSKNISSKDNLSEMCDSTVCIPICCELGHRMIEARDLCTSDAGDYLFPDVYEVNKKVNNVFQLVVSDPCESTKRLLRMPDVYHKDEYIILINGSVYYPNQNVIVNPTTYCFAIINENKYELIKCIDNTSETDTNQPGLDGIRVGIIVPLPFLLVTFVVYTVLKELWNLHGYILRGYVGSLFVVYVVLTIQLFPPETVTSDEVCIALAFITQFSFLASFFWLNVMCFNIWRTFGELRPVQENMTREERKKFIIYSIYAWGCASIFTIICAIMDFVPSVPKHFIKPELGKIRCWFATKDAEWWYFCGPISVIIICNIYMFISTAWKFVQHKKNIAPHLSGTESRRHGDNKQSFILCVKLFILMGICWSMEMTSWIFNNVPLYLWYLSYLANALQGFIIFVIFVWTDKIKKLLLRKFGC